MRSSRITGSWPASMRRRSVFIEIFSIWADSWSVRSCGSVDGSVFFCIVLDLLLDAGCDQRILGGLARQQADDSDQGGMGPKPAISAALPSLAVLPSLRAILRPVLRSHPPWVVSTGHRKQIWQTL